MHSGEQRILHGGETGAGDDKSRGGAASTPTGSVAGTNDRSGQSTTLAALDCAMTLAAKGAASAATTAATSTLRRALAEWRPSAAPVASATLRRAATRSASNQKDARSISAPPFWPFR